MPKGGLFNWIPPHNLFHLLPSLMKDYPDLFSCEDPECLFPLEVCTYPEQQPYISCIANRYQDSSRSPWSNTYRPPLGDAPFPSDILRNLEVIANSAMAHYSKQYFASAVSSVYALARKNRIILCILIKSSVIDVIHMVEISEKTVLLRANYNMYTTYIVRLNGVDFDEDGTDSKQINFGFYNCYFRQTECNLKERIHESHVENIGRMVEELDAYVFGKLRAVYSTRTRHLLEELRQPPTSVLECECSARIPRQDFINSLNKAMAHPGNPQLGFRADQPDPRLVHAELARLCQQSLGEVRRLRIHLTNLLNRVPGPLPALDAQMNNDKPGSKIKREGDSDGLVQVSVANRSRLLGDNSPLEAMVGDGFANRLVGKSVVEQILHTVDDVKQSVRSLDEIANSMMSRRNFLIFGAFNLISAFDQLDFSYSLVDDGKEGADASFRRVDWLIGQTEASRWLRRTNYLTDTITRNLRGSSLFRRTRDVCKFTSILELDEELVKARRQLSYLALILIEPESRNPILHVTVGNVMQCLISFGNFYPEQVIVRGLEEPSCIFRSSQQSGSFDHTINLGFTPRVATLQASTTCTLLPNPKQEQFLAQLKTRRCSEITSSVVDLSTPSRHTVFRRITDLARCAVQHFYRGLTNPHSVFQLLAWLNSYADLFTKPCKRCGQLLGQDAALPVSRGYFGHFTPQHEHC